MGNFSISHYAAIRVARTSVQIHYILDVAEIPTLQELQESGIPPSGTDPMVASYLKSKSAEFANGLQAQIDGVGLRLSPVSQEAVFTPGAGGLSTMKLGFVYQADVQPSTEWRQLKYADRNYEGRAGWKEIAITVSGVEVQDATAIKPDRSAMLSDYPADLLSSPPQDTTASITFRAVPARLTQTPTEPTVETPPPAEPLAPSRQPTTPRNAFTELVNDGPVSLRITLIAALIAAGLGALHALEPGHGKTIVAAYLVGSRGTARHAVMLGLIVTVSHTAAVYLLGAVTLYLQRYIVPDHLYPMLGVLSGVLVAGTGLYLLLQRFTGPEFGHIHGEGGHTHFSSRPAKTSSNREIALLGLTGGMVPCPAALVVMLSAAAVHRAGFGLYLIVFFSAGLALVLIAMGLTALCARRALSRAPIENALVQKWLPAASAAMISLLGAGIALKGLAEAGLIKGALF